MKRIQTWTWVPAALLLAVGGMAGWADDLAIQSFDSTGKLTFSRVATATTYRVEWAPTPGGPWTNTWAGLDAIEPFSTDSYTCSVPMCYRVIATCDLTNGDYLVVDLSGGPWATKYPVSYLADVPAGGWTDDYKTNKLVLRRIPAGTFAMGCQPGELGQGTQYSEAAETLHTVTLTKEYYIGVFELTQRQWELVMGNRPSYFNNSSYYAARPVEQVGYYDIRENQNNSHDPNVDWPNNNAVNADSFMGKLRAKTGWTTFDLPTEAQWEYACRAGTATALNSGYNLTSTSSDSHMDVVGRYKYNGGSSSAKDVDTSGATAKVGSYQVNNWGLYDMHGNVNEWCLDWVGLYPGTVSDPQGPTSGYFRVTRGGDYSEDAEFCRSAERQFYWTEQRAKFNGLRVACTQP